MKKLFFVTVFAFLGLQPGKAQGTQGIDSVIDPHVTVVQQEAEFPGGTGAFFSFLSKNLDANVAAKNKAPMGYYNVVIKFIVEKDGTVSGIFPETKLGYGTEDEVVRVMKLSPNWVPAKLNGIPVRAYRRQPITFVVSED